MTLNICYLPTLHKLWDDYKWQFKSEICCSELFVHKKILYGWKFSWRVFGQLWNSWSISTKSTMITMPTGETVKKDCDIDKVENPSALLLNSKIFKYLHFLRTTIWNDHGNGEATSHKEVWFSNILLLPHWGIFLNFKFKCFMAPLPQ